MPRVLHAGRALEAKRAAAERAKGAASKRQISSEEAEEEAPEEEEEEAPPAKPAKAAAAAKKSSPAAKQGSKKNVRASSDDEEEAAASEEESETFMHGASIRHFRLEEGAESTFLVKQSTAQTHTHRQSTLPAKRDPSWLTLVKSVRSSQTLLPLLQSSPRRVLPSPPRPLKPSQRPRRQQTARRRRLVSRVDETNHAARGVVR